MLAHQLSEKRSLGLAALLRNRMEPPIARLMTRHACPTVAGEIVLLLGDEREVAVLRSVTAEGGRSGQRPSLRGYFSLINC